MLFSGLLLCVA